ncbi:MAG TPA: hypothetical protein VN375_17540 [Vicinamibacteria bacterium]|nr:hypothetical protein [Vicinamibacteria bacterium]
MKPPLFLMAAFSLLALARAGGVAGETIPPDAAAQASRQAFLAAYPVFAHPRCVNCHPRGDQPLQGDSGVPHAQRVKRGPAGLGQYAVKCAACHQTQNLAGAHMPPGAPNWHLPPPSMPMVFEGLTPGELCRQLKDPARNGGKVLTQIVVHVTQDPLVGWGWAPGEGRTPAPGDRAAFAARVKSWADQGAACPP